MRPNVGARHPRNRGRSHRRRVPFEPTFRYKDCLALTTLSTVPESVRTLTRTLESSYHHDGRRGGSRPAIALIMDTENDNLQTATEGSQSWTFASHLRKKPSARKSTTSSRRTVRRSCAAATSPSSSRRVTSSPGARRWPRRDGSRRPGRKSTAERECRLWSSLSTAWRRHACALRPRSSSARSPWPSSGPRSSSTAQKSRRRSTSRRSSPAKRCGARASPSPAPAPTSPLSRPGL